MQFAEFGKQLEEKIMQKVKLDLEQNYVHITKFNELEKKVEKALLQKDEIYYQRHLERILGGRHTVTKHGISDIETENAFYEIKRCHLYKNVVGQLKAYSRGKPHKHLIAALFGDVSDSRLKTIVEFLNSENIYVVLLKDLPDGGVVMVECGKKIGDIEDLTSTDGVLKAFLDKRCVVSRNKNDRVFTQDIWDAFVEWKETLKFSHVSCVKKSHLYKYIDKVIGYDHRDKIYIDQDRSAGWYGIKLKTPEEESSSSSSS